MKMSKAMKETLAHNVLHNLQNTYQRTSSVYCCAHEGLMKMSNKALDAMYVLSMASRNIQNRVV